MALFGDFLCFYIDCWVEGNWFFHIVSIPFSLVIHFFFIIIKSQKENLRNVAAHCIGAELDKVASNGSSGYNNGI